MGKGLIDTILLQEEIRQPDVADGGVIVESEDACPERLRVMPHVRLLPRESTQRDD